MTMISPLVVFCHQSALNITIMLTTILPPQHCAVDTTSQHSIIGYVKMTMRMMTIRASPIPGADTNEDWQLRLVQVCFRRPAADVLFLLAMVWIGLS